MVMSPDDNTSILYINSSSKLLQSINNNYILRISTRYINPSLKMALID